VSDDDLKSLREQPAPGARADFVDSVMRQVATRPLPKQNVWRRLFAERQVTLRVRPASWAVAAVAAAALVAVLARPRHVATTVAVNAGPNASAGAPVMVRFALAAAQAREVSLAGDFNGWRPDATPLQRGADGLWSVQVPLSRGNWSYSFVVDGHWVEDPQAENWRADGFGGRNAIVRVGDVPAAVGTSSGG
jgi:hypothetical protein